MTIRSPVHAALSVLADVLTVASAHAESLVGQYCWRYGSPATTVKLSIYQRDGGDYRVSGTDTGSGYYSGDGAIVGGAVRLNIYHTYLDGNTLVGSLLFAKLSTSTLSGTYVRKELHSTNDNYTGIISFVQCP